MKASRFAISILIQIIWFCLIVSFFPREMQKEAPTVFAIYCIVVMVPVERKRIYEFFQWKM